MASVRSLALVLALLAPSCAGAASTRDLATGPVRAHAVPPDIHGEPLALLPPLPLLTLRIDAAELRRSTHWLAALEVLRQNIAAELATADRELGFDPLEAADVAALALYAPPRDPRAAGAQAAWPVLYVRGRVDAAAVLATARARVAQDDRLVEHAEGGVHWFSTRDRAYLFPAPDVVIMFEPRMTGRVLRRLAGGELRGADHDARFASLEQQVDGFGQAAVRFEADTATLRSLGAMGDAPAQTEAVDQVVARADVPGDLSVHAALVTTSDEAAAQLVQAVDELRAQALGQFVVRVVLGMGRLLQQGLTAVNEGRVVRLGVEARSDEVTRLLHASRLLQMLR
jgi:hypothetical protein